MKRPAEMQFEEEEPPSKRFINESYEATKKEKGNLKDYLNNSKLIEILQSRGVKALFPIQYLTFDYILAGKDLIARDKTGSGKTLAFALPVIQRMRDQKQFEKSHMVKFLIVLPTRQLTIQVRDEIEGLRFNDEPDFRIIAVYGKSDITYQIERISKGIDIIVATPGRLIDLLQKGVIEMDQMQVLCLDQADEMLKQGFKEEVQKIYKYIRDKAPKKTQNLLFSATIPAWLEQLSQTYLDKGRQYVNLVRQEATPSTLDHYCMKIGEDHNKAYKQKIVVNLIKKFAKNSGNTLIFCQRKIDVAVMSSRLDELGIKNRPLHGDVIQSKRQEAYRQFKKGNLKVLVATNVAARGLDFPDIDLVVQADPPTISEPYIHRSGRTARMGKQGTCVTLFTPNKEHFIRNIEREIKTQFKPLRVEDFLAIQKTADAIQVYAKYLPIDKTQEQVKSYFEDKGINVKQVKLMKTSQGSYMGCGFIRFQAEEDQQRCLKLDGCEFAGNQLSLSVLRKQY